MYSFSSLIMYKGLWCSGINVQWLDIKGWNSSLLPLMITVFVVSLLRDIVFLHILSPCPDTCCCGFLCFLLWVNFGWLCVCMMVKYYYVHVFIYLKEIWICVYVCRVHPAYLPASIRSKTDRRADGNSNRLGKRWILWWVYISLQLYCNTIQKTTCWMTFAFLDFFVHSIFFLFSSCFLLFKLTMCSVCCFNKAMYTKSTLIHKCENRVVESTITILKSAPPQYHCFELFLTFLRSSSRYSPGSERPHHQRCCL